MNATQMRVGLARAGIMAQAGEGPLQQLGHVLAVVGNIMTLRLSAVGSGQKWAVNPDKRFGIARYNLIVRPLPHSYGEITNNVLVGASAKAKTFSYSHGAARLISLAVEEGKPVCQAIGALNVQDAASVLDQLYKMYAGEELLTNFTATADDSAVEVEVACELIRIRSSTAEAISDAFLVQKLLSR